MSLRQSTVNFLRRFCVSRTYNFLYPKQPKLHLLIPGRTSGHHEFERRHSWSKQYGNVFGWIFLSAQAAIMNFTPALAEDVSTDRSPENETTEASSTGFRKVEDGSIVSNEHTSKWRIFTDHGRDLFLQRKLKEAEFFFLAALKEAKEGFGDRDAHVASACNNVAELYRVTKEFDKAEPLYLEAIRILEETYGPDDVRVGAAIHNLGQFYIVQQKLEHARVSYEIKRRVLGEGHPDYAETMYHLANVLYLQGNENDSEALVLDSVRILEEGGLGASPTCIKRMQFLAQIYAKSNRFAEAENMQRRILHLIELSKGWNSLDTVIAADRLSVTLQSAGSLKEAEDLMERCLAARKTLLPENHIQIAANIVNIASVKKLKFDQLRKINISQAMTELEKAKALFNNSIRLCHELQVQSKKKEGTQKSDAVSARIRKDRDWATIILLQSYHNLAWVETAEMEVQDAGKQDFLLVVENTLRRCISAYTEYETLVQSPASPEVKAQYILCLKNLSTFLCEKASMGEPTKHNLEEIKREIKRVES
ncbi:hypothetical protein LIER_16047 [Lithospermum erythrorhizon]|uniref:Kinesin light chain n=1 Tax=Lithospermum erythrorhizon TaxID=34254 RepID=A0AAV3Q543_LITER